MKVWTVRCQRCNGIIGWVNGRWESTHGNCCFGTLNRHWVDKVDPDDPVSVERFLDNPTLTKP